MANMELGTSERLQKRALIRDICRIPKLLQRANALNVPIERPSGRPNDRLQAREMLAVEIERTWSEVQESYAQILLTRRSVTSAAENLRQNRNFYQAGTAPLSYVMDAETIYTRSRNDFTSACAAYRTSLARYMRVTGR